MASSGPGGQSLAGCWAISRGRRRVSTTIHAVTSPVSIIVKSCVRTTCSLLRTTSDSASFRCRRQSGLPIMELSTIVLVALFHDRQIARSGRQRFRMEVRVLQRVDGVDTFLPVKSEKLLEKLNSSRSVSGVLSAAPSSLRFCMSEFYSLAKAAAQIAGPLSWLDSFCARKLSPARHIFICGCTTKIKNDF